MVLDYFWGGGGGHRDMGAVQSYELQLGSQLVPE